MRRRLNCLWAVEAIGRGHYRGRRCASRPCRLNCLSAVEAIGSGCEHSYDNARRVAEVSIAFRLLKRLVAGERGPRHRRDGAGVSQLPFGC